MYTKTTGIIGHCYNDAISQERACPNLGDVFNASAVGVGVAGSGQPAESVSLQVESTPHALATYGRTVHDIGESVCVLRS